MRKPIDCCKWDGICCTSDDDDDDDDDDDADTALSEEQQTAENEGGDEFGAEGGDLDHRVHQGAAQRGAQFCFVFAVLCTFLSCSEMSLFYLETCAPMKAAP